MLWYFQCLSRQDIGLLSTIQVRSLKIFQIFHILWNLSSKRRAKIKIFSFLETDEIGLGDVFTHVVVMVLMWIDLIVLGHPIKMRQLLYTISLDVLYAFFTLIYYLCGGLDKKLHYKIYPLLDWHQPFRMVLVLFVTAGVVLIFHSFSYGMLRLRNLICDKIMRPKKITAIKNADLA